MSSRTLISSAANFKPTPLMLSPPVRIADHFHLALVLLILGFFITCWFLLYE